MNGNSDNSRASLYDAIIIPGGGVKENFGLPIWVQRRMDRVLEMHRGEFIICLSGGTVHKPPPLDSDGRPIHEAVAGARYLVENGAPPGKVLWEIASYDTIGNAYFARVIHTEPRNLKRLLVLTSDFHLPRTQAIFQWVFGLPFPAGSPANSYSLSFEAVPDDGIEDGMLQARRDREAASMQIVEGHRQRIHTFEALHHMLFIEHDVYKSAPAPQKVSGKTQEMY